jgi:1,4-dihydroxy-6-naphthoate synthase
MKLTLGLSPCPNDTFIFDALANGALDLGGLELEVFHEDVQTLNEWALAGRLDATKLSYGVLPRVTGEYGLLEAGGALGRGVGPLLVTRPGPDGGPLPFDPARHAVAIPGEQTTAHLLFSLAYPGAARKQFTIFSGIEAAVAAGRVDAGVIIHESRFTYAAHGLAKVVDLGDLWERRTGAPIPLGGIVVRRSLGPAVASRLEGAIRESLRRSWARWPVLSEYVRGHAQALDEAVMRQHVELYVNEFTEALGAGGRAAVATLLEVWRGLHPEAGPVTLDCVLAALQPDG